jgi:hypothetical protein
MLTQLGFGRGPAALLLALLLSARPARAGIVPTQPGYLRLADPAAAFPTTLLVDSPLPGDLTLTNGLAARTFSQRAGGGLATTELLLAAGEGGATRFLRGVAPEARVTLQAAPGAAPVTIDVGGLAGQTQYLQLYADEVSLSTNPLAMAVVNFTRSPVVTNYNFTPRWGVPAAAWPPRGLHLAVEFGAPEDPGPGAFFQLNATAVDCSPAFGCLQGWHACDNSSVPGQCSFPRATAVDLCRAWPACAGVQCNPGRSDCQARAAPILLSASFYDCYYRSDDAGLPGVDVAVHYELYDGLPVIKKWVTVSVTAPAQPVAIDALYIEHLRAPNFAPEQIKVVQIQPNNPTPFSEQIVPDPAQSFPGRTQQLWYFDDAWDACCDQELHVSYSYYTRLMVGYGPDVTFGGLTGPGALVSAGDAAPFESIAVRLLFHDTTDFERQGLGTRRMQQYLAPQLQETPLYTMINDISSTAAFHLAISQAAAAGLELVVVGYGANGYCGMCPGQLQNATWVAWFKSNVDFARSLGVSVTAYTLMQHNGWGEDVPEAEQVLQRDGTRGGIACFATDWHAAYRQSVLDFIAETGMMGVETDGQYEGAFCGDTGGDHHHNGGDGSWHAQMQATAQFNVALKAQRSYQTGADAYMWSGANKWNHADTDAGYGLGSLWERLSVGRDYIYDSTTTRLHSSGMYGVNDIASASRQCDPTPGRLVCVDFALASFLGQGVVSDNVAPSLFDPSDPDAAALTKIFKAWSDFFAAHRPILTSAASLHIVRPTARALEATVHLLADPAAPERGLLTIYNPSSGALSDELPVNLYYAGYEPGSVVVVSDAAPATGLDGTPRRAQSTHTVGADGGLYDIVIGVALPPRSHAHYVISSAA